MSALHFTIVFENGEQTGAYAAGPEDAVQQVYAEDVNGDQPNVVGVFLTGNRYVGLI